jgi:hypothetical protein
MSKTKTARSILEAIADGERDPQILAAMTHSNVRGGSAATEKALEGATEKALEGMLIGSHHPALIRMHLDHITLLDRLAAEVEAALAAIPAAWGVSTDGVPSRPPVRTPRSCPQQSGSPRSPASASSSPWRSSQKRAWT